MKKLLGYFFKGLLVLVPIAVTVYVVYLVFTKIDHLLPIPIPGVGFVATIVLIILVGFLASNIMAKSLLGLIDKIFTRLPFIKLLYNSVRDLTDAFVGDKKIFDKPVLVSLSPDSKVKMVGFITKEDLSLLGLKEDVAVYLPQSYNFSGNLIIVPKDQVTPINRDSSEVMAFIISAGVSGKTKES